MLERLLDDGRREAHRRRIVEDAPEQIPRGECGLPARVIDHEVVHKDQSARRKRIECAAGQNGNIVAHTFEGKPPLRGSADPAFHGDPMLYNPEDLLLSALSACHMLSYLAVCAHAGIVILSYEDTVVGTLARRDGRVRFVDALLRPKVVLEPGSDIKKAKALHEKAHDICVIVNSVNFPVRHEAEVITNESMTAA